MPVRHVVALGDYLLRLAARFGFRNHRTIEDAPENAQLKATRYNLNVLAPGDEIVIPDKQPYTVDAATNATHRYRVRAPLTAVNMSLRHEGGQAMGGRSGAFATSVETAAGPSQHRLLVTTSPAGDTASRDGRPALDGRISLVVVPNGPDAEQFELRVGHLLPLTTRVGQQARLNNLGYFAGYDPDNDEQFQWAVEEFQCDFRPQFPAMKVRGPLPDGSLDGETLKALGRAHGDFLPGQEAAL